MAHRPLFCDRPFSPLRPAATSSCALALALLSLGLSGCGFVADGQRRLDDWLGPGWPKPNNFFREAALPVLRANLPVVDGANWVDDDAQCASCHRTHVESFRQNVHYGLRQGESCEACHGPCSKHVDTDGKKPALVWSFKSLSPAQRSEICLRCHEENACKTNSSWRTSVHAHRGVSCLDCHTAHHGQPTRTSADTEPSAAGSSGPAANPLAGPAAESAPPAPPGDLWSNLGAVAPQVCYRCHGDMADLARIAGPHQIGGPNNFNCTSCHDAHGRILQASRTDLCLTCHQRHSPTMAWHSSIHAIAGVTCTDCHNPHPRSNVPQLVDISHTSVRRPERHPMSVQQPEACYKCHPEIYGLSNLPSHHPLLERKLLCSDCHDAHGQTEGGLREPTVNQVCYRCHAEKQGPFAYEHPPVTEDCAICHEPHGTVTNNLLRQPATFLCLRCHAGHRSQNRQIDGPSAGSLREALYADCTQCHAQIHGSDRINETLRGRGLTR